jgi:hypothetical protein
LLIQAVSLLASPRLPFQAHAEMLLDIISKDGLIRH